MEGRKRELRTGTLRPSEEITEQTRRVLRVARAEDEADVSPRKITLNLKPRGQVALAKIQAVTGEDITDAVNDALRLYAMVLGAGPDSQLYIVPHLGDGYQRIHLP
jgi:hypothetical protein